MTKGLLRKLKIGIVTLGLTSGLTFGEIKAQTNLDYKANDKNIYDFYNQKQESLYMNYYKMEEDIQARCKQKKDSIYDVYQNYYKKKIGIEDKNNSLEFFLPDSLENSFKKKVDSLNRVFDPEKEKIYNDYKQKNDSISIQCNQKIYKDYRSPKEDSILENILKDFLGEYRIDTLHLDVYHGEGIMTTDTFRVYKTLINYFGGMYSKRFGVDDNQNRIEIWENRELAKWLQSIGEEKRDSLKKSILKEKNKINWQDLDYARQKLDKNYPKEPVRVPGTNSYFIPTPGKEYKVFITREEGDTTAIWNSDEAIREVNKKFKFKDE